MAQFENLQLPSKPSDLTVMQNYEKRHERCIEVGWKKVFKTCSKNYFSSELSKISLKFTIINIYYLTL